MTGDKTPDEDSEVKASVKKPMPREIFWLPMLIFCLIMIIECPYLYDLEMNGTVTHHFDRSGYNKGLFLRVDDGPEFRASRLWDKVKKGDRVEKKKGSFIILINDTPLNCFFEAFKWALGIGLAAFLFYFVTFFIFGGMSSTGRQCVKTDP